MATIYVRMPWYVAAFVRGRDEEHQLSEWEPIKYSTYHPIYRIMEQDLRYMSENRLSVQCLSQKGWQNVVKGKKPGGGKALLVREPTQWPTAGEMCALWGKSTTGRQLSNDYLCIEIPKVVYYNRENHRTNSCYALSYDGAKKIERRLYAEYCSTFYKWMENEQATCRREHIDRKRNVMVERFLVQYNIFIDDEAQMETLRRMSYKWMKYAKENPVGHGEFQGSYANHISDEEREKSAAKRRKSKK